MTDEQRALAFEYLVRARGLGLRSVFSVEAGDPYDRFHVDGTGLIVRVGGSEVYVLDFGGNLAVNITKRYSGRHITAELMHEIGRDVLENATNLAALQA